MPMPTRAEFEKALEEFNFAENAYKQKLANIAAMMKAVLAATWEDAGVKR